MNNGLFKREPERLMRKGLNWPESAEEWLEEAGEAQRLESL
jgi:hypothetical protein